MRKKLIHILSVFSFLSVMLLSCSTTPVDSLKKEFKIPPDSSKPGVYWYFVDGNLNRDEMTKDLESMKEVGISNLVFLEVGIGVPRGPVDFMSEEWQDLYVHAVREAERLGIKILLGAGPGWTGSGGPWVKPEESMKHLVFSETGIEGNKKVDIELPIPEQRSTDYHQWKDPYYEDVAVYAIPHSAVPVIADINEKALYERDPYSSKPKKVDPPHRLHRVRCQHVAHDPHQLQPPGLCVDGVDGAVCHGVPPETTQR